MGEQTTTSLFSPEVIEQYAGLGVDLVALFSAGDLGSRMGVEIVEATAERVVGTMPVEGNTQPYGLLHGGASAVLAETIGSIGAMLHGGPGKIAVGVDLNCTHHRGLRSGKVTGVATPSTAAARPRPTRSSSATSRTAGSAPPASPACCARPPRPPPVPRADPHPGTHEEPSPEVSGDGSSYGLTGRYAAPSPRYAARTRGSDSRRDASSSMTIEPVSMT